LAEAPYIKQRISMKNTSFSIFSLFNSTLKTIHLSITKICYLHKLHAKPIKKSDIKAFTTFMSDLVKIEKNYFAAKGLDTIGSLAFGELSFSMLISLNAIALGTINDTGICWFDKKL